MRWIAVGTVTLAAALCLDHSWGDADDDIVFAAKNFVDLPYYGSVAISGTLTGDGVGYKNNTISIYIAYVEQIGPNQIGRLADAECRPHEIMAITGHVTLREARMTAG